MTGQNCQTSFAIAINLLLDFGSDIIRENGIQKSLTTLFAGYMELAMLQNNNLGSSIRAKVDHLSNNTFPLLLRPSITSEAENRIDSSKNGLHLPL